MELLQEIREKRRFVLSGHEHPDGDCLGAQTALWHLLKALGKQAVILNPDPLTRQHEFLLRHTPFSSYEPGSALPELDVLVLLDCAELGRLGALGRAFAERRPRIAVIDHHVGSEHGDGDVLRVDATAPSTGALVYDLHKELGVPLSAPAAEGVLLSLVADTGWFRYSNTDARVLHIAGELLAHGVDASRMFDALYRRNHPDSVQLLARALASHQLRCGGKYVYATIDRATMDHANRVGFDTDLVLEPMRSVEGVEVTGLFKERGDGAVKLSLRASGDVDVQAIAKSFGGGGHKKAAGATLTMPLAKALMLVEQKVQQALEAG